MGTRIEHIAARLLAATGSEVRRIDSPEGIRLEADLPADLSEAGRRSVLATLADADGYGHENASEADYVWARIDPRRGGS